MPPLIRILFASFILHAACQAGDAGQPTVSIAVHYLDVTDAYQRLKPAFPEINDIVRTIQIDQQTLVLNPAHAKFNEVRQMLAQIDVIPTQIQLSMVVTEKKKDGTEKTISRSTHTVLEGQPATLSLGLDQGKELQLTISPSVLANAASK